MQEAIERGGALPAVTGTLFARFRLRDDNSLGDRLLSARRQQFGGHAVKTTGASDRASGR